MTPKQPLSDSRLYELEQMYQANLSVCGPAMMELIREVKRLRTPPPTTSELVREARELDKKADAEVISVVAYATAIKVRGYLARLCDALEAAERGRAQPPTSLRMPDGRSVGEYLEGLDNEP